MRPFISYIKIDTYLTIKKVNVHKFWRIGRVCTADILFVVYFCLKCIVSTLCNKAFFKYIFNRSRMFEVCTRVSNLRNAASNCLQASPNEFWKRLFLYIAFKMSVFYNYLIKPFVAYRLALTLLLAKFVSFLKQIRNVKLNNYCDKSNFSFAFL